MEDAGAVGLIALEHWEIARVLRGKGGRNVKPEDLATVAACFPKSDDKPVLANCEDLIVLMLKIWLRWWRHIGGMLRFS